MAGNGGIFFDQLCHDAAQGFDAALARAGVNRVSLGLQALDDETLRQFPITALLPPADRVTLPDRLGVILKADPTAALDQQLRQSALLGWKQLPPQASQVAHRQHDLRFGEVWPNVLHSVPYRLHDVRGRERCHDLLRHQVLNGCGWQRPLTIASSLNTSGATSAAATTTCSSSRRRAQPPRRSRCLHAEHLPRATMNIPRCNKHVLNAASKHFSC